MKLIDTDSYEACLARAERGSKEPCDPYAECPCPPKIYAKGVSRLSVPIVPPDWVPTGREDDYREYANMPLAPYPPGGAPTGGNRMLNMSPEEYAKQYQNSRCYKCQVEIDLRHASSLDFGWKFWLGLGAAGLGVTLLVASKR